MIGEPMDIASKESMVPELMFRLNMHPLLTQKVAAITLCNQLCSPCYIQHYKRRTVGIALLQSIQSP